MKRFFAVLTVLSCIVLPSPAYAQEPEIVEKTVCLSATGFPDVTALKGALLTEVKREAVNEFFGELISASTAVENLVVTSDQIQASSLGFVRIFGDPSYYNGSNLAEVCVTIQAYVTESDRTQFEPVAVGKRLCLANSDLTADALAALVKKEVVIQALYDYDPKLEAADRTRLPELMERITYSEGGFLQDTTTYCATMGGYVTPVEVLAFTTVDDIAAPPAQPEDKSGGAQPSLAASTPAAAASADAGQPLGEVTEIPVVESLHPYANGSAESWFISNDSTLGAMQLHFARVELEEGVDRIRITDADGRLMQVLTTSYPDGLWSELVPGVGAYVWLESDSADTAWGFSVDSVASVEYQTIGYSAHPYGPRMEEALTFFNEESNPEGTQLVFDRIELEENVDWLIILDVNDEPYQWITGSHPEGLTTVAVPGPAIKVGFVTDSSIGEWGYNVVSVKSAAPVGAESEPEFETIAETPHPYENGFAKEWTLTNPDPSAASTKIHFKRLETETGRDVVTILDSTDTVIQQFSGSGTDFWTDYVPGRVVKIRFTTDGSDQGWGFRVDRLAKSVASPGLAQTDHPYANGYANEWTLTNPDPAARSTKIHFTRMETEPGRDNLQILDSQGTVIQVLSGSGTDFWTDYVPGRVVKIRFTTDGSDQGWGFRVDRLAKSVASPGLAQTDHPYANGYANEWTLTNPDPAAIATRVHFTRMETEPGRDIIDVSDSSGTVIQQLAGTADDFWTEYVPGRVVKIRFTTDGSDQGWGFRIDEIESK